MLVVIIHELITILVNNWNLLVTVIVKILILVYVYGLSFTDLLTILFFNYDFILFALIGHLITK